MSNLLLLLAGCGSESQIIDLDQDGFNADVDCNDGDENIHPLAAESCDEVDHNCDGSFYEGFTSETYFLDADGDGFGDASQTVSIFCEASPPEGYVANADDCDDDNDEVKPGQLEFCDGIDNNCVDGVDENSAEDVRTWYFDGDGDGYGLEDVSETSCYAPESYTEEFGDCNDDDINTNPDAIEECADGFDKDCDGVIIGVDGDGDGLSSCEGDCDDTNINVNPSATEFCNNIDDNCNTLIDEPSAEDAQLWTIDSDSDGFGDVNQADTQLACDQPVGYVLNIDDCDDGSNTVFPGATEFCNDIDDDCDTLVDESAVDADIWYLDGDSDGFGGATNLTQCDQPVGYVLDGTDCDDGRDFVYPGASELCDGLDNDCDFATDEDPIDGSTYYEDFDSDGFGNLSVNFEACSQPAGFVVDNTDCDDTANITYPGADEICDGEDNDCNVTIDDNPVDGTTYYLDSDSDLFGDANDSIESCTQPGARVLDNTDCDDANNLTYPGADEICDGEDNNCNVTVDENPVDGDTYYQDFDNDSYGDPNISLESCTPVGGYALNNNDCNDTDAVINPTTEWYADGDGDGHGAGAVASIQCDQPVGEVLLDDDCNDAEPLMSPGLTEVCGDWLDNDCDGGPNQCVQPSQMFATSAAYKVHGETMTAEAAYSSALIPDINGDGLMEHVVGARQDLVTAGISYFMMSPLTPGDDYTGNYDLQVMGRYSQDSMGQVVEDCSFIDGDGLGDVCMGSPLGRDTLSDPMVGVGHIMTGANIMSVLPGPAGRVSTDATIRRIVGQNEGDLFAFSIAGHFDFEGNGTSDVMFGAPGHDNGSGTSTDDYGAAYLESGYPASNKTADPATSYAFFHGTRLSERAGIRVAGAGDLDADGTDEVAISNELSEIHLYYGDTLTPGVQALAGDAVFLGEGPDDYAGLAISHGRHQMKTSGTTLNGDQYDDFVIAAPNADPLGRVDAGKVYVVFGDATKRSGNIDLGTITSNNGMEILGPSDGFLLGLSVAVMGDHDGDGVADLLIGSLAGPTEVGQAIIIKGPLVAGTTIDLATDTPDTIIDGNDAGDRFGFHVGGGDYDGDGYYEAVTGAYKSDEGGTTGAGTAIIHSAPGL